MTSVVKKDGVRHKKEEDLKRGEKNY